MRVLQLNHSLTNNVIQEWPIYSLVFNRIQNRTMPTDSQTLKTYIYIPGFKGILRKKINRKKVSPGGGQFDYRWKDENPIW